MVKHLRIQSLYLWLWCWATDILPCRSASLPPFVFCLCICECAMTFKAILVLVLFPSPKEETKSNSTTLETFSGLGKHRTWNSFYWLYWKSGLFPFCFFRFSFRILHTMSVYLSAYSQGFAIKDKNCRQALKCRWLRRCRWLNPVGG